MKAEKEIAVNRTSPLNQRRGLGVAVALACLMLGPVARGQSTDFEPLLAARQTTALLEQDGLVIAGLEGGGLAIAPVSAPAEYERLAAGSDLSGNAVTDLCWTGRHVWVATDGGGLTRIADVAGSRQFRQYANNLSSLEATAVTGAVIGQSERVYYGTAGSGLGVITDGLSGAVYSAEQDGVISDTITALQLLEGVLFVGTPSGISRFANNIFTDQNSGLTDLTINDLALDADGFLLAATEGGLFRWNDAGEEWTLVGGEDTPTAAVSCADGLIYTLGTAVRVYNGDTWRTLAAPSGVRSAIYAGNDFWLGGRVNEGEGGDFVEQHAYIGRLDGDSAFAVYRIDGPQVLSAGGIAFSGGVPYLGAQAWLSVISARRDGEWNNLRYQRPRDDNQGARLSEGVLLSMASGPDGVVWSGLYAGTGLARTNPATGMTELIEPNNSGLRGKGIVNVVVHPDGPVLTLHDFSDDDVVEVLVEPDNWADASAWLVLPRAGALGEGPSVWDAVVQRRDVIWFAVESVGLVRWDINGDAAGPDDPLTWFDQSDDRWDTPLASVFGSRLDLRTAFGLAVGADGSIWAGGNGLVQFSYDETERAATLLTSLPEKTNSLLPGLVNGNVNDIARDRNGDIWAVTASGVNRVRGSGQEAVVDAYFDLGNYFANPLYGVLYSPNVIAPLPGNQYRKITPSADGTQLLIGADQGVSLVTVGEDTGNGGSAAAAAGPFLYPNPFHGDQNTSGLKLGGIDTGAVARVEIYNLDGQVVYKDSNVTPDVGFWPGTNRVGQPVASGLYTVRVLVGSATWTIPLAVVR